MNIAEKIEVLAGEDNETRDLSTADHSETNTGDKKSLGVNEEASCVSVGKHKDGQCKCV